MHLMENIIVHIINGKSGKKIENEGMPDYVTDLTLANHLKQASLSVA